MDVQKWLNVEKTDLSGKLVVLTGATGGLGSAMSRLLLSFGARLVMINRDKEKSEKLTASLKQEFPRGEVRYLLCDLNDLEGVKKLTASLQDLPIDILMLNAGTYAIPRALSSAGFDTVFQVNFLSHYYMVKALLPLLKKRKAKVIATGSIAHRFHAVDFKDPDYAHHEGANDIYGNSKRFLIFALMELLHKENVPFAVGHPGISFTGITSNYPPRALKIVKPSMLLLFMHPEKACLSMVKAIFEDVPYLHWIGPRHFDIWGKPQCKVLDSCPREERVRILETAEEMVKRI